MKILVIDDNKTHLTAALQTLASHDVTVCTSHDNANKLLEIKYDEKRFEERASEYRSGNATDWDAYYRIKKECRLPYWDVVLTDLLMPAGHDAQGYDEAQLIGKEMPIGWSLALVAATRGAKFTAVVSDMNHHCHPASALLDRLNHHILKVDDAKVLMTNYVHHIGIVGTECACVKCNGKGKKNRDNGSQYDCCYCDGSGRGFAEKGKDWGKILDQLLGIKAEEDED